MSKWIISLFLIICCTLVGCTKVLKPYRPPIQQGNIITSEMVDKIHVGLSKSQVLNILGNPVLADPFDENTWTYVYTLQPSRGKLQERRLVLHFVNNRVVDFSTNIDKTLPQPSTKR